MTYDEELVLSRLREANLQICVLHEKRRVAKAAYAALQRWGRHEDGCEVEDEGRNGKPLPCNCGFKACKREWRLASLGRD